MAIISSRSNDRIKAIRALREKRERDSTGTFFVEGHRVVQAALQTGAVIELLVVATDRLDDAEASLAEALDEMDVPILEVTPELFDVIAFREEAQSIGAIVRQRTEPLEAVAESRRCWLVLNEVQHPGNLGTLIRNNDAIGGDGVILMGQGADPYHPQAVRGTLGAIFSQRIVRATHEGAGGLAAGLRLHGRGDFAGGRRGLSGGRLRLEARRDPRRQRAHRHLAGTGRPLRPPHPHPDGGLRRVPEPGGSDGAGAVRGVCASGNRWAESPKAQHAAPLQMLRKPPTGRV